MEQNKIKEKETEKERDTQYGCVLKLSFFYLCERCKIFVPSFKALLLLFHLILISLWSL